MIMLDHHKYLQEGMGPKVVSEAEWERWFRK